MNYFKSYIYILLTGTVILLSSCEMQKELRGKTEVPGAGGGSHNIDSVGALTLTLEPEKEAEIPLKSGSEESLSLDVSNFEIDILNEAGEVVKHYNSYQDMLNEGSIILPKGIYNLRASLGELIEAGFDAPYYEGSQTCNIDAKKVATITMKCPLANKKITIQVSEDFYKKFQDNYTIILTNGSGILTQRPHETRTAYFKDSNQLDFIIHATTTTGQHLTYSSDIYDNSTVNDHNNILVNLDLVPDTIPSNPGEPEGPGEGTTSRPSLIVDISLIEKDYVIEIPSSILNPEEEGEDKDLPSITGTGINTPVTLTVAEASKGGIEVKLNIKTPNGLKSLVIQINTTSSGFMEVLTQMGLDKSFDMMNLSNDLKTTLEGVGLSVPSNAYSNVFDISEFVPLLVPFGAGNYNFKVTATDKNGKSVSKTSSIILTK